MPPDLSRTVELRLRAAVESSPSGLLMVDAEGRMVLVNSEIERLFGYSREELLGKPVDMLIPNEFRDHHPAYRAGFFARPSVRRMGAGRDLFGLRKDGTEVPVEIGLTPVATEEGLFVLSSIVDITARRQAEEERRRLEEQLRHSQKMQAVGTLAGGIAHDFNNILGAIVGYAELLRGNVANEQAESDVAELLAAAARGKRLVERILAFSRRQEAARRPLSLSHAVTEAARLLRATLPTSIEIHVSAHSDTPRVTADATSIHQILMNLGTNAAHAMPDGGLLQLTVEPYYLTDRVARAHPTLREGLHVLLTVRDTGHGVDPAIKERVFEPFFTTKPAGVGTGLGLAVVHSIIAEHEGAVQLDSDPGEGTQVRCFFPALEAEVSEPRGGQGRAPRGAGQRVLFVDDEPSLARLGERRLGALGYTVSVHTRGPSALEAFLEEPSGFDIIVTDFTMPHMNGLELAREVRRVRSGIPVIMLTGFIEDIAPEVLVEAGVVKLLKKPVTQYELGAAIAEALRHAHDGSRA